MVVLRGLRQWVFYCCSVFSQYWGLSSVSCLKGRPSTAWVTPSTLYCIGYFQDSVLQTIFLGWHQTLILLISASWVARITGMKHHWENSFNWLALPGSQSKNLPLPLLPLAFTVQDEADHHELNWLLCFLSPSQKGKRAGVVWKLFKMLSV
jgi:hypothetical protein